MNRPCPSAEQLKQLTTGNLSDPSASELESHLLKCSQCQEATASMRLDDTFIQAIRVGVRERQANEGQLDGEDQARVERIIADLSGLDRAADPFATEVMSSRANEQVEGKEGTNKAVRRVNEDAERLLAELAGTWSPAERPDELGRLGGYRVLKLLGAGGMGGVFLAEDMQLKRHVALKVMRPHIAATPGASERFMREAQAAAAVRHDHVVTIYQVGQDRGVPFIAQELLDGETLEDRMKRLGLFLPIADAVSIAQQIAAGLAAAHARGLIHRDIKPANVWLQESRGESPESRAEPMFPTLPLALGSPHSALDPLRVKLLDFGLARAIDDDSHLTQTGVAIGTPSYMAPEQAGGEDVDARADLFSLGVVLYRMTTGQLPFPGRNAIETLKSIATVTPVSPQSLNPAVPSELSDLIERLLVKDRNTRTASAREVSKALGDIAKRESLSAPTPALGVDRTQPPRRWRIATALGAVSAVLLLAVVLFVQTRGGTLKIEAADGIDASVVKEQVTIRDTVSGKTYEVSVGENSMRPGQYEIVLRDRDSGLEVSTERVEIQRGNSTPLRITLQADAVVAGLPTEPPARRGSPDPAVGATAGLPDSKSVPKTGDLRSGGVARSETGHNKAEGAGSVLTGLQVGPVNNTLEGIIPRPARLPGIARWQAVTAVPRKGVTSVAWSKLGQIIARDGSHQLRFYDAASLELRRLDRRGDGPVTVSSDGQSVTWGGRILRLDEPDSMRESSLGNLAISPDGKLLAGQRPDGKLSVQTIDGAEVRNFDHSAVTFHGNSQIFIWSSDSRRLCVLDADRTTVSILNLDGTTAASFATGHTGGVTAMSWSPDGTLLATSGAGEYRLARVAEVKGEEKRAEAGGKLEIVPMAEPVKLGYLVQSLAWSPDSQRLAIGWDLGLLFVDRSGKELARATTGPIDSCLSLAWSPDGREVAAGQWNGLIVWTADGQFARAAYRPLPDAVQSMGVEWNGNGTLAVTSADGTVRFWEPTGQPGLLLDSPGTQIYMATWSPDGDKLLTSESAGFQIESSGVVRTWSAIGQPGERWEPSFVGYNRWHSDGRRRLTNWRSGTNFEGADRLVVIFDPENNSLSSAKTTLITMAIASQPKGNLLLIGGNGGVGLWRDDGTPGPALKTEAGSIVTSVAWHPTEPIFAASTWGTGIGVRIGNADGKWLEDIHIGDGNFSHVAWSPDGLWLAMVGANSNVWLRAADGRHGLVYGAPGAITSFAWSPDNRTLAIGLPDHRLIVRDLFAEETKWVAQHLPPQLNPRGEVGRHGAAVVFSEAGELLHVAHSVAAKSAGPARATAEPPRHEAATLLDRYTQLDGLIFMQVETLAEPGKTQILKPSEFVQLVEFLAQQPLPSFDKAPLDQPIDLLTLAAPKLPIPPASTELRTTVPRTLDGEYDLTLAVTAPAQPEWLGLGLVWRGQQCEFHIGPRHAGLQRVDGQPSSQNETTEESSLVAAGQKIEIVCQVRDNSVIILSDGKPLIKWRGDPARLSAAEGQSGLGNAMPTLRCSPGWTIHAWTLTPRGKGMSPAALPAVANANEKPNAVRHLLDDGCRLQAIEPGVDLQGDYPVHTLLPANDRIVLLWAELTSRALQAARQLPNLEHLACSVGEMSPERVTQLNQLTQLKALDLRGLNIRDEDLANLTLHDKLAAVTLNYNPLTLTDGLLDRLAGCSSLRQLSLDGNSASEESLMKLDRLVQLESLDLSNSQVTDRVLDRLQTLPNLKGLSIHETPATAARVEAFRKAKPNCQVDWSEKK